MSDIRKVIEFRAAAALNDLDEDQQSIMANAGKNDDSDDEKS